MIFSFLKNKKDQKGIALLMALFCVMIISFMAVEISFDTSVEYLLSNKEYHREKAYAAAKAGVDLSLLRIQLFKNVTTQFAQQLKGQQAITQMIWSLPFSWPPAVPDSASITDKDQMKTAIGNSLMDARYAASISSEGSKIDVNDLDSPSEALRKAVHDQLVRIFEDKIQSDQDWADKHRNFDYNDLINNIQDWIDADSISLNGGDEKSKYPQFQNEETIPPNRPFETLDELKMVAGMTDEIFQMLLPHITVYGIKAINVNQADSTILKSIDPIMTDDIVAKVVERRSDPDKGGPFKDLNDLTSFIGADPQRFNPTKIPLYFGNEYNFRIRSIGEYQGVTREIIAIVYDVEAVKDQLKAVIDQEIKDKQGQAAANTPNPPAAQGNQGQNQQQQQQQQPQGKPRIVYWWEN